ncbi:MAG: DUF6712 family protein [Janthinobacterium lividum]
MSLIRTTEQFCAHVRVNSGGGFHVENVEPDLRVAEREHLRPVLGPALYNELTALSDADVETELATAASSRGGLLRLVHEALANLGLLEYLPLNQLQINDAGVYVTSGGSRPFQWQIDQLTASLRRKGYNALEAVLEYLEAHAADFPAWTSSLAYQQARELLIASAAEFTRHYDIAGSRLTYQALLPVLRKVERFELEPVLSYDYLAELKAQLVAGQVSAENVLVLERYLRPALAHLVVAKAVGEVGLSFNGSAVELNVYRPDDSNSKEADANLSQLLSQKAGQAQADAQVYLQQLRQHLNTGASPTRFATYYASSAYVSPTAPRPLVVSAPGSPTYFF